MALDSAQLDLDHADVFHVSKIITLLLEKLPMDDGISDKIGSICGIHIFGGCLIVNR